MLGARNYLKARPEWNVPSAEEQRRGTLGPKNTANAATTTTATALVCTALSYAV